ncbi:phage baseplate upper protein [Staphylococcus epidermidis]|uniref:phage baseplate upper protein n=1 Tax=Staphylococcus epidermidis TaxID=1282 RepID=UPI001C3DDC63|nr:phage baseplate upper protein [Staphylococcus epidermidis]MBV5158255.1 phage baseplate upper protein [Staphylococcus epidermidis]
MYNKEGKIKLETSAHYSSIGNTDITFYDSDVGTADLIFYITRNQRPLEVSDENVDCFLMLKAKDGTYIVDTAHVVDPLNGKVKYTVPKEFLTHTGNVKGQVWIAVHGKEDIITEVEFSFAIKGSMFTTVPAVDKLNYIRTFEDLRERIEDRFQYIEESLANGDGYVTQMDATFQSGMKSLNDRSQQVINEVNNLADKHKQELNDLKDNNITEIDNKANQIKEDIEELNNYDTSNWQKYKMTNDDGSRVWLQGLDPLTAEPGYYETSRMVNGPMNGNSGIFYVDITPSSNGRRLIKATYSAGNRSFIKTVHTNGKETEWKEITSTNTRQWLGTLGSEESGYNSVLDLPPGLYECSIPSDAFEVDAPLDPNGASYIAEIDVYEGNDKRKQIKLVGNYRNDEYHATVHTKNADNPSGNFRGWKRLMNAEEFESMNTDTGWIDWNTKNGATKRETDKPEALQNQYRVVETNGKKQIYVRANINNIESQMNVGSIPKEYTPKAQNFYIRTPVSMNPAVIYFDTEGQIWVYLNLADKDKWITSNYIYGEVSWIIDDTGSGA